MNRKLEPRQVAILGGGIAGLAASLSLRRVGVESVVYEQSSEEERDGMGFILQANGLDSVDELGLCRAIRARGCDLQRFILQRPDGGALMDEKLSGALGVRRSDIIGLLRQALPARSMRLGMRFTHFEYDAQGLALRACFANGEKVEAHLFIASDGMRSRIRAKLFPEHALSPVRVKELCSLVHAPHVAERLGPVFLKIQDVPGGLAAGVVPCGTGYLVWYIQFDASRWRLEGDSPEARRAFAQERVGDWPKPLAELLECTDFSRSHLSSTSDLDVLPTFHQRNVVLVGDAAHPLLTFTSQGVNAALQDALALPRYLSPGSLEGAERLRVALSGFSEERRPDIGRLLQSGRHLAEHFLYPERFRSEVVVPLSK